MCTMKLWVKQTVSEEGLYFPHKNTVWEKRESEIVCVIFYFFFTAGKAVVRPSVVSPWRNPHQTVETLVNRGHGACSVPFSHRTGVVCVLGPTVWPSLTTYCVMLPRELSFPWDCWSGLPHSLSRRDSQLSFLINAWPHFTQRILHNTWYLFYQHSQQLSIFGVSYKRPLALLSLIPLHPDLLAPWVLPRMYIPVRLHGEVHV